MGFFFTLLYLVLSLIRPAELFPVLVKYHLMDVIAGFAVIGTALGVVGGRGPSFRSPQLYLAVAFVTWAGFSVFAAQRWLGGAMHALGALATSGFLLLLITLNVDTLPRLHMTRRVLIVLAVWLVIQGGAAFLFHYGEATFILHQRAGDTLEGAGANWDDEDAPRANLDENEPDHTASPSGPMVRRMRALGFLNDPNDLAQMFAAVLPLVFLDWRARRPVGNLFLVVLPAALIVGGIAMTRSRGGLVAVAAMTLAAIILFGSRVVSGVFLLASALGLIAGLAFIRNYVLLDESSLSRVEAWYQGLQMLKSSPVWGVGYGGFTDYNRLVAHNSFIHCLAELGVIGYGFWLGMIVVTFHDLSVLDRTGVERAPLGGELRRWARASGLALVGFLAGAFLLSRAYSTTLFVFLALPTALADVARRSGRAAAPFSPFGWALSVVALQAVTLGVVYGMVRLMR